MKLILPRSFAVTSSLFLLTISWLQQTVLADRTFSATSKASRLRRRGTSFEPRLEQQSLMYADYATVHAGFPASAARVSFTPRLPMLLMEDVESHVSGIQCVPGRIELFFYAKDVMMNAYFAWSDGHDFILISSAPGCGQHGEHSAHVVSYVDLHESPYSITLRASQTTLRNCTDKMHIDLGDHIVHDTVEPTVIARNAEPQQIQSSQYASTNYQTASLSLTSTLSFAAPTASATTSSVSGDVSFSRTNTNLFPPDSAFVQLVPNIDAVEGLEINCLNCSMNGRLELSLAGFSIDTNAVDQAFDFFDDGFFQFNAIGMSANMSFEFLFQPGFPVPISITPQLPPIPLTPFGIPGVLQFGPALELTFPIQITLNSVVKFSTGFTLQVPENSSVVLNISDIESSTSKGFQDATLTPLPFDVNADNLSLNFSTGFRPQLVLGAGIGPEAGRLSVEGGVGAFLDLPKYTAVVTAVKNKTDNCEDAAPANEDNTRIYIEPFVGVGGGVLWELGLNLGGLPAQNREGEVILFETNKPLPTECLLFDSKSSSIVQAGSKGGAAPRQVPVASFGLVVLSIVFMLL